MSNVIQVNFRKEKTIKETLNSYHAKRSMTKESAVEIINDYAKNNYTSFDKVIAEWFKYETRGACKHFFPTVNLACQIVTDYPVDSNTVITHC
jgi:hypothetical protein